MTDTQKCPCINEGIELPIHSYVVLPKDEALLDTNGYQKFPSGLIIQWGRVVLSKSGTKVSFPIAFPNACHVLNCGSGENTSNSTEIMNITPGSLTKEGFIANVLPIGDCTYSYIAIGS
ncbi:hypothetical protein DM558_05155 [Entomomonas moraniae]|uniref:Putative tail fiber protein gp53-like C-terminal domain-containing protein n=1 Tax=Entomomonas moraniae TaxID=2213226 RepID=A0A3Q9JIF2_9GAMM|nr:hypothetical protein [Entomomonas moraniae]AZS50200.1 hypothetical protein DM558_05155 [Entomomonas moraniae]